MKLLLDAATLIWLATESPKLSPTARRAYENWDNDVYISVVSIWEMLVKVGTGKLALPASPEELLRPMREIREARLLPLEEADVLRLQSLPPIHRDPFDRMLVCQALARGLTLVTPDDLLRQYPVSTLW